MVPPLFPQNANKTLIARLKSFDVAFHDSMEHTIAAIRSSIWVIAGVVAIVAGTLGTLVVVVLAMGPVESAESPHQSGLVRGSWTDYYQANSTSSHDQVFNAKALHQRIAGYADSQIGTTIGVVVTPVWGEDGVWIGSDRAFTGASTTKILTAVAVLSRVDRGDLRLDSVAYELRPKVEQAEDDGLDEEREATATAMPTPEPKKVSIEEALRLMVNRSDNIAWEHLINLVGSKNLQKYANGLGMKEYSSRNNEVSPRDLAVLLQKLYRGELLSESSTKLLLAHMQQTNEEQMISEAITNAGEVYHKYGWFGAYLHDVAIVDNHGQPVVVVIMTEGFKDHQEGKAVIREMAEMVESELGAGW